MDIYELKNYEKYNPMKRECLIQLFFTLVIVSITALTYFSKRNQLIMNKLVVAIVKSFYFNSTPVISISILAIGEYFLWESQTNKDLIQLKTRLTVQLRSMVSVIHLDVLKLPLLN